MRATTAEADQAQLLDTSGKEYNRNWVDEQQPLFVPNKPLHFKAHKLQVLLARLDKQATHNAAAFSPKGYITVLDAYTKAVHAILEGKTTDESLDTGELASERTRRKEAEALGAGESNGLDSGVSADNPFAGEGPNPI